jgi:hypothetical protein
LRASVLQGDADSAIDKLWSEKRTAVNQNF